MNSLLQEAIRPMVRGIKTEARFNLAPSLPKIYVDSKELTDAFQELIMDAVRLMEEKGKLTVETSLTGDYIKIGFSDTGP